MTLLTMLFPTGVKLAQSQPIVGLGTGTVYNAEVVGVVLNVDPSDAEGLVSFGYEFPGLAPLFGSGTPGSLAGQEGQLYFDRSASYQEYVFHNEAWNRESGGGGSSTPTWLPDGALLFMDFVNGHYYADGAVVDDPSALMVFNAAYFANVGVITNDGWAASAVQSGFVLPDDIATSFLVDGATAVVEGSTPNNGTNNNTLGGPEFWVSPGYDSDWWTQIREEEAVKTATYPQLPDVNYNVPLVGDHRYATTISSAPKNIVSVDGRSVVSSGDPGIWPDFNAIGFFVLNDAVIYSITLYAPKPDAELPILSAIPVVQNGPAVLAPRIVETSSELITDGDLATDPTLSGWTLGLNAIWSAGQIVSTTDPDNDPAFTVPVDTVSGSWYRITFAQTISGDTSGVYFDNNSGYWVRDEDSAVIVFQADFTGSDVLWLDFDNYNPGATRTITSVSMLEVEQPVQALIVVDEVGNDVLNIGLNNTDNNFSFGYRAGLGNTGVNVTIFGVEAGKDNGGTDITLFGAEAGINNTEDQVSAFGFGAGKNNTGQVLTAFGRAAGKGNQGDAVTVIGGVAGVDNTGQNLTAGGFFAGINNTGNDNTVWGYFASVAAGKNNAVAIGSGAQALDDNTVQLGNASVVDLWVGLYQIVRNGNVLAPLPLFTDGVIDGAGPNVPLAFTNYQSNDTFVSVVEYVFTGGVVTGINNRKNSVSAASVAGTVTAFSDNGLGGTTCAFSAAFGPQTGTNVTITGTTDYDGVHIVGAIVQGVSFDIPVAFVLDEAPGNYLALNDGFVVCSDDTTGNRLAIAVARN